ncbi:hypothetical protein D3C85_1347450 [compost metagenome]
MIEARRIEQPVRRVDIGQEELPRRAVGHVDAVEIAVLAPDVRAHAQAVLFGGGDHAQFILFEETADLGKLVALLAPDFNREHDVAAVAEAKGNQGMGNGGPSPVREGDIHGLQVVQRVAACFPAGREVGP